MTFYMEGGPSFATNTWLHALLARNLRIEDSKYLPGAELKNQRKQYLSSTNGYKITEPTEGLTNEKEWNTVCGVTRAVLEPTPDDINAKTPNNPPLTNYFYCNLRTTRCYLIQQ
ncbi:unnamed protein product [Hermetia illucens]|uniref:Uncharacterized protein n=1 Tax=Hermetia illucens TaxID=343691 RepID=A0A7R8V558_HERIL|nr:unnamed protein product [Hermetia illucens]